MIELSVIRASHSISKAEIVRMVEASYSNGLSTVEVTRIDKVRLNSLMR